MLRAEVEKRVEPDERYEALVRGLKITAGLALVWLACLTAYLVHQASSIQDQRRAGYMANCTDQTLRHDRTVRSLDDSISKLTGAERLRAQRNRDYTVALINSLAPIEDCDQLVRERVK